MKRVILLVLILVILTSIAGCAAANTTAAPSETQNTTQATTAATTIPTTLPTTVPTTSTEPSQTTEDNPIYQAVIQIEGTDETVNYRLMEGRYDYAMPMDVDRFQFRAGEEADFFHSIANQNAFMTVTFIEDTDNAQETAIRTNVAEGIKATAEKGKLGEHDASIVHVVYGSQPDSKVMDFFLIESGNGVYEINLIYTIESAEGFGARMTYMAQGFVIR